MRKRFGRPVKRGSIFNEDPSKPAKFLGAHHGLSERGIMTTHKVQMKYVFPSDAIARYLKETNEKTLSAAKTSYLSSNPSPKRSEEPEVPD